MKIPPALIESLQKLPGFDEEAFKKVHESGEQITSIRLNRKKIEQPADGLTILDMPADMESSRIPWNTDGYYLSARPSFTADPLFHGGAYYVQEASSMFLELALKQSLDCSLPLKVLDLCAAPGGKSTLIQSVISDESLLVSNEVIKARVTILSENIAKWGAANVIVTNNDPKDFKKLPDFFDAVVVDAPCSGSGLFRKDPNAINEWSEQSVETCSFRQQRILADVLPSLKPGGVLIYSTCSYSIQEDEAIAGWLINEHGLINIQLQLKNDWNIVETHTAETNAASYRFYPDKLKGEGFFIAAFKKQQAEDLDNQTGKIKSKSERITAKEIEVVSPWLKNAAGFFFIKQYDDVVAIPLHLERDLAAIQATLYIKKAGVKMGSIIRNELIPDHELAISNIISPDVPFVDVDKETALQYLRRQEIKIDSAVKGWALLRYRQLPLGWIKALPNRVNNYYPKEWRILHK